eukprot:ANDGO_07712.mRNA.1 Acyl-coenzyme A oxidase
MNTSRRVSILQSHLVQTGSSHPDHPNANSSPTPCAHPNSRYKRAEVHSSLDAYTTHVAQQRVLRAFCRPISTRIPGSSDDNDLLNPTRALFRSLLDDSHASLRLSVRSFQASHSSLFASTLPHLHSSELESYLAPKQQVDIRQLGAERLRALLEQRFVDVRAIATDPRAYLALVESVAGGDDLGHVILLTVQLNLFGASILLLGHPSQSFPQTNLPPFLAAVVEDGESEKDSKKLREPIEEWTYDEVLDRVSTGNLLGCFALTELGHGTNAAGIETTATFDAQHECYVLCTPGVGAQKYWIGGAARNASHAIVLARLLVPRSSSSTAANSCGAAETDEEAEQVHHSSPRHHHLPLSHPSSTSSPSSLSLPLSSHSAFPGLASASSTLAVQKKDRKLRQRALFDDHGVHAFFVQLRSTETGKTVANVEIRDCGQKMGNNSIDNGRLFFHNVRLSTSALLSRYSRITCQPSATSPSPRPSPSGLPRWVFETSVPGAGERFAKIMAALLIARIVVAAGSVQIGRIALDIAIRYAHSRCQFGPPPLSKKEKKEKEERTGDNVEGGEQHHEEEEEEKEWPIIMYPLHASRLMPELVKVLALGLFVNDVKSVYASYMQKAGEKVSRTDEKQVHRMAAMSKASGSWIAVEAVQTARECCGGAGYALRNLIPMLRADAEIFTTFDGDNHVLCLSIARLLLLDAKSEKRSGGGLLMAEVNRRTRFAVEHARHPFASVDDPKDLLRLFGLRVQSQLAECALGLKGKRGRKAFQAFNDAAPALVRLAKAHCDEEILMSVYRRMCSPLQFMNMENPKSRSKIYENEQSVAEVREILTNVLVAYGCVRITQDPWFLASGLLSAYDVKLAETTLAEKCDWFARRSLELCRWFDAPEWLIEPTIAGNWMAHNESGKTVP